MTAKIFLPQRTQRAQRKIFVFFVPFVVQFWLRPKWRYEYWLKLKSIKNLFFFLHALNFEKIRRIERPPAALLKISLRPH